MNPMVSPCDDNRLRLLIVGEENSADFADAAQHVEMCAACQNRLSELAADQTEWTTAKQLLSTQDLDPQLEQERAARSWSIASPLQPQKLQPQKSWTDAMARQLLSEPSHPEMLGRLGRYEIERLIGSGGMGVVFMGFDSELNRPVAIKVLAPHLAGSGAARKRFSREAKAAAAVVHEHVIAIHNVESEAETPFLVMPLIAGESLQSRIDRQGPLELREVLRIAHQTAAGLAAAHKQGLVHRDVKPSNIMLEQGVERALLTDFGLARASDDASLTHSGTISGTPHYMSPEQARGDSADQRSDLFSLGSTIYAMCTGRLPFRAETSYGVLRRITDDVPTSISEINSDMPQWLERVVARLMSKTPAERFDTADEVSSLLEKCLAHVQQPSVVPLPQQLVVRPQRGSMQLRSVLFIAAMAFVGAAAMMFMMVTAPPDIAGQWHGEGWGNVQLESESPKVYHGTYSGSGDERWGSIELRWSRIERRFNGTWSESTARFGQLSVHLVDGEIHGALTTVRDERSKGRAAKLAELVWRPGFAKDAAVTSDDRRDQSKSAETAADAEQVPIAKVPPAQEPTTVVSEWEAQDNAFEQLSKAAETLFETIQNEVE